MQGGSLAFDPPEHVLKKLARVRFVVMDVDGTIRSAEDDTAEAVSQTLGRLDSAGIGWSFATGRTIAGLQNAAPAILARPRRSRALLPSICYNGGVIFVPGVPSIISIRHMDRRLVLEALAFGTSAGMPAVVYCCSNHLGEPRETVYTSVDHLSVEINGMATSYVDDWGRADLSSVVAVLLASAAAPSEADLALVQDALGEAVSVTASGASFFEISSALTSKGEALSRLLAETGALARRHPGWTRYLGLTEDCVMAIGDNHNDAQLLLQAGVGVAVANAPDAIKQSVDIVCSLPAGQGTVEAIRFLLDVKRYYRPAATGR